MPLRKLQFVDAKTEKASRSSRLGDALAHDSAVLHVTGQAKYIDCLLYTSPSPRDQRGSRMPSSA